jgi:ferredoxin
MAGATTVQVASIIYIKGPKVIGDIVNGIRRFMERKGYNKLEDFRGISLDKILSKEKLRAKYVPMVASVDIDKCTGCGICIDQCLCDALSLKEGTAEVDKERCMGCEICVQICPVKAISLRV